MKFFRTLVMITLAAFIVSCGNQSQKTDTYYVSWSSTGFYKIESGSFKWKFSVPWGTKYRPATVSNYVTNINKVEYVHVISPLNKNNDGYINQDSLIKNPVSRGVILNSVPFYIQPTKTSTKKVIATPPVLVYVVSTNNNSEGSWVKLMPFKHSENFFNAQDFEKLGWMSEYHTKQEYVSTSDEDVTLVVGVITTMRTYLAAEEKNDDSLETVKKETISALNDLIKNSPNSGAVLYARQALEYVDPSMSGLSGDAEGNPLLDETMSDDVEYSDDVAADDSIDNTTDTEIVEDEEL